MAYENVVFVQGEEAHEFLDLIDEMGASDALDYMLDYLGVYEAGTHEVVEDTPNGLSDQTYTDGDGFTLSWNTNLDYVGIHKLVQ